MKDYASILPVIAILFVLILLISAFACRPSKTNADYVLTHEEKQICENLKLDTSIIHDICQYSDNKIEAFHYSHSTMYNDGEEIELDPIHEQGLVFHEKHSESYNVVMKLKDKLRQKGYTIFLLKNNYNIDSQPDRLGILKTTDQFEVLKLVQTNGLNYDIDTDSLITIMKNFDAKYSIELIGASGDWCEFLINGKPKSWSTLAKEVYEVCPDVVDQGAGTIDVLEIAMQEHKRLYFWWD